MNRKWMLKRLVFALVLLASMGGLLSCTPTTGEGPAVAEVGPRAWIDFPRDGVSVPVGASVIVVSHAYAADGVAEMLLSVNGTAYRRDPPAASGDDLVEVRQEWSPQAPGVYTLEVRAYDAAGDVSGSDAITVHVPGEETGEVTVTPTIPPGEPVTVTPTEVPVTNTPTIPPGEPVTVTPTDVPVTVTPTDVPVTVTPTPEAQIQFWVDAEQVNAGTCTTVHWRVQNVQAVFFNGNGAPGEGTHQTCPCQEEIHRLTVTLPDGSQTSRSLTIRVSGSCITPTPTNPPPDTTPPPVPQLYDPADESVIDCPATGERTLEWLPVSDPSGVVYYAKLEQEVMTGQWSSVAGWGPVSETQVEAVVQCGGIYRWTVRAQDGAGNISPWATYFTFSVNLN